ncbi:hypothetical protein CDAR_12081 [Caerostris darwini]|uniref:Uncharacterized protein n=1 Tax=Caerostris darwini TaxID=1538125 RepID=A0AAV4M4X2_9ARAC|nr:hypothetical protein CDAR_12081 [Caerostris darwini]
MPRRHPSRVTSRLSLRSVCCRPIGCLRGRSDGRDPAVAPPLPVGRCRGHDCREATVGSAAEGAGESPLRHAEAGRAFSPSTHSPLSDKRRACAG